MMRRHLHPLAVKHGDGQSRLNMKVHDEAVLVRNDSFTRNHLLPPPISVRQQAVKRVESAKEAHFPQIERGPRKSQCNCFQEWKAMANMRRASMGMSSGHSSVISRRDSTVGSLGSIK